MNGQGWLRTVGAVLFLGAALLYLVEGWTDPRIVARAGLLSAATTLLAALGIVAVRRWQDARGARLLLGLSAATLPVHCAQLGAAAWAFRIEGSSGGMALLMASTLVLAAVPVVTLGLSALVRRRAVWLTGLLVLLGCPLVLTTRDPGTIALIAAVELSVLALLERRIWRHDPSMQSPEALGARALLFVPAAILILRNAFHGASAPWAAACLALPCTALIVIAGSLPRLQTRLMPLGVVGLLLALVIALPQTPALGLWLALAAVALDNGLDLRLRWTNWLALLAVSAAAVAGVVDPSSLVTVLLLPVGLLVASIGYVQRSAALVAASVAVSVFGFSAQLVTRVTWPEHDLWVPAAVLGIVLMSSASIIEKQRRSAPRWLARLRQHFAASEEAS